MSLEEDDATAISDLLVAFRETGRRLDGIRLYHRETKWPPTGTTVCVVCGGATWPCATWRMAAGEKVEPR
jgi:hypothetical protein